MKAPEDMRVWIGGGVAVSVVVAAAGWFMLVSPELSTIPALQAETATAQVENAALQTKITALRKQSAQLPTLVASLRTTRAKLPITASLPTVLDQLDSQARAAKVAITSLAIGSPTVVTGTASTAAGSSADSTTDSGTAAAATPTTSAAAGSTDSTATTPTVATGPAGQLFEIQLSLITSGPLKQQNAFLAALQYSGARAALVTSVQLASGQGSETTALALASSMTTQVSIFVAPQTPAVAAQLAKQLSSRPIR